MMLNRCIVYFFLWLTLVTGVFADNIQVKEPESPGVPDIIFNDPSNVNIEIPGEIYIAGQSGFRAIFQFNFKYVTIQQQVKNKNNKKSRLLNLLMKDLRSIEIKRWYPVRFSKNSYRFIPVEYLFTTVNGQQYTASANLSGFNILYYKTTGSRTKKVFTYFYDYRKNNTWIHANRRALDYPYTNPLKGTVVKLILFNKRGSFRGFKLMDVFK